MKQFEKMISYVRECGYDIHGIEIDALKLIFEERVKMNCFYCAKYNSNWKCSPKLPMVDVKKMFSEFDNAALIWVEMMIDDNYSEIRNTSSVMLHRAMLECERWLWNRNNSTALSFIGGSCKLCKNGCASNKCANPYQSRSPVEALGINIIKSAKLYDIKIDFPPTDKMKRIGLLLW